MTTREAADREWCRVMLPKVSRTFAACIGLLPEKLENAVLLAYLLCRIADTIEDDPGLSADRKSELLGIFSSNLESGSMGPAATGLSPDAGPDAPLVVDGDRVLREYRRLDDATRACIRPWVEEMCQGMAWFARECPRDTSGRVQALVSLADLDRYCYYVAGTVGHLLTALFANYHKRLRERHFRSLSKLATSFGLGLQMVNIIKDVADDNKRGWSYIPAKLCAKHGITPADLVDPKKGKAARKVMNTVIKRAQGHLDNALEYCCRLPRSAYKTRLFCLTPLFFAVRTLSLAKSDPKLLDPSHKVKITRKEVYQLIRLAFLVAPSNRLTRRAYRSILE